MAKPQLNADDESQVVRARDRDKLRAERDAADLKAVLSTAQGRRFFWRLVGKTGLLRSSMTGNSQTFYLEGRRSIGIELWDEMEQTAPEAYLLMLNEARTDSL